jgi:hypothetical protein
MFWKSFLECCRTRQRETLSPASLGYYTQTALIMGMQSLETGKAAKFDAAKEQIVI